MREAEHIKCDLILSYLKYCSRKLFNCYVLSYVWEKSKKRVLVKNQNITFNGMKC